MARNALRWPLILGVVIALVSGACSGDDKTVSNASASPSSSSPAASTTTTLPSSSSSGGNAAATWTTWGHDAARSGVTEDGPSADGLQKVWTSPAVDGDIYAQPLVVG